MAKVKPGYKPAGRPKLQRDDRTARHVHIWAMNGLSVNQCCAKLRMDPRVFHRLYAEDHAQGLADGTLDVGSKVRGQAMKGCRVSQALYLRTVGKWSDKHAAAGEDAPAVQHHLHTHTHQLDASKAIGSLLNKLASDKANGRVPVIDGTAEPVEDGASGRKPHRLALTVEDVGAADDWTP